MTIDVRWNDEQHRILLCEFHGEWTWHDCREAVQNMVYLQDGISTPAHFVYDLSHSTLPTRACLNLLQKLLTLEISPAPDQIVIVDKDYRLSILHDMLTSITQHQGNVHFVSGRAEIYHVLSNH
jgi:hypothetical protein